MYILAKQHPITPPELFAAIVADHFVQTYKHIHVAHVEILQHRWTRMNVDGKPHPHSFVQDGSEKRVVEATATDSSGIEIRSGIKGLLVLKSTGSAFYGYDTKDPFTRLPETDDRLLCTEVECGWKWNRFTSAESVKQAAAEFDPAWDTVRNIILRLFAEENSPSVQNTMYKMCDQILAATANVHTVDCTLPNKHYFDIGRSKMHPAHISRLTLFQILRGTKG